MISKYIYHAEKSAYRGQAVLIDMNDAAAYDLKYTMVTDNQYTYRLTARAFGATQSTGVRFDGTMALGLWKSLAETVGLSGDQTTEQFMIEFIKENNDETINPET